eukprot:m.273710 g.273710  ORF g.273710 m.273710 type:complete len:498 (-) comp16125_c0_seq2:1421-2914(-)
MDDWRWEARARVAQALAHLVPIVGLPASGLVWEHCVASGAVRRLALSSIPPNHRGLVIRHAVPGRIVGRAGGGIVVGHPPAGGTALPSRGLVVCHTVARFIVFNPRGVAASHRGEVPSSGGGRREVPWTHPLGAGVVGHCVLVGVDRARLCVPAVGGRHGVLCPPAELLVLASRGAFGGVARAAPGSRPDAPWRVVGVWGWFVVARSRERLHPSVAVARVWLGVALAVTRIPHALGPGQRLVVPPQEPRVRRVQVQGAVVRLPTRWEWTEVAGGRVPSGWVHFCVPRGGTGGTPRPQRVVVGRGHRRPELLGVVVGRPAVGAEGDGVERVVGPRNRHRAGPSTHGDSVEGSVWPRHRDAPIAPATPRWARGHWRSHRDRVQRSVRPRHGGRPGSDSARGVALVGGVDNGRRGLERGFALLVLSPAGHQRGHPHQKAGPDNGGPDDERSRRGVPAPAVAPRRQHRHRRPARGRLGRAHARCGRGSRGGLRRRGCSGRR